MTKIALPLVALILCAFASCKRAYECTCTTSSSSTYVAIMPEWQYYIDLKNNAVVLPTKTETVTTFEKTPKASVHAVCATTSETYTSTAPDDIDADTDFNYSEAAFTTTKITKTECSFSK